MQQFIIIKLHRGIGKIRDVKIFINVLISIYYRYYTKNKNEIIGSLC